MFSKFQKRFWSLNQRTSKFQIKSNPRALKGASTALLKKLTRMDSLMLEFLVSPVIKALFRFEKVNKNSCSYIIHVSIAPSLTVLADQDNFLLIFFT